MLATQVAAQSPYGAKPVITYRNQPLEAVAVNVVSNALVGSIGSLLHKPKGMSAGRALLRGAARGAAGGAMIYLGKALSSQIYHERNIWYGWGSRAVVSLGASMVENTILHKPLLGRYGIDVGPMFVTIERGHVRLQVMPLAAAFTVSELLARKSINWEASGQLGTLIFNSGSLPYEGLYNKGSFTVSPGYQVCSQAWHGSVAHEHLHALQFRESLVINQWARVQPKGFWRVFKVDFTPFDLLYPLLGDGIQQSTNWYEREAQLFSTGMNNPTRLLNTRVP
jgi:hypothetical protein